MPGWVRRLISCYIPSVLWPCARPLGMADYFPARYPRLARPLGIASIFLALCPRLARPLGMADYFPARYPRLARPLGISKHFPRSMPPSRSVAGYGGLFPRPVPPSRSTSGYKQAFSSLYALASLSRWVWRTIFLPDTPAAPSPHMSHLIIFTGNTLEQFFLHYQSQMDDLLSHM